jgi:hypothetical protein
MAIQYNSITKIALTAKPVEGLNQKLYKNIWGLAHNGFA